MSFTLTLLATFAFHLLNLSWNLHTLTQLSLHMHHCSSSRRVFAIVNLLSIRCKSPDLRLRWQNRLAEIYVYAILEVIYVHRKWVNEYEFVVGCRRQAGQVCRRWTCRRPKKGATAKLPWWCSLLRYYRDIWRVHFMTTLLQLSPTCPHTHTHKMQPHSLFAPAKYSISTRAANLLLATSALVTLQVQSSCGYTERLATGSDSW